MAGCAGWLFAIMNESGYRWGSYSPLICIREGGREEGIKKMGWLSARYFWVFVRSLLAI